AVGHDEAESGVDRLAQAQLEVGGVIVAVAEPPRLAQADAVDDRRMVQLVREDGVLGSEQGLEDSAVRVPAAGIEDGVLGSEELREPPLELPMNVLGAADEPDAGHAVAPLVEPGMGGLADLGMLRETEVVVG